MSINDFVLTDEFEEALSWCRNFQKIRLWYLLSQLSAMLIMQTLIFPAWISSDIHFEKKTISRFIANSLNRSFIWNGLEPPNAYFNTCYLNCLVNHKSQMPIFQFHVLYWFQTPLNNSPLVFLLDSFQNLNNLRDISEHSNY